jgi:hypothetical protein
MRELNRQITLQKNENETLISQEGGNMKVSMQLLRQLLYVRSREG